MAEANSSTPAGQGIKQSTERQDGVPHPLSPILTEGATTQEQSSIRTRAGEENINKKSDSRIPVAATSTTRPTRKATRPSDVPRPPAKTATPALDTVESIPSVSRSPMMGNERQNNGEKKNVVDDERKQIDETSTDPVTERAKHSIEEERRLHMAVTCALCSSLTLITIASCLLISPTTFQDVDMKPRHRAQVMFQVVLPSFLLVCLPSVVIFWRLHAGSAHENISSIKYQGRESRATFFLLVCKVLAALEFIVAAAYYSSLRAQMVIRHNETGSSFALTPPPESRKTMTAQSDFTDQLESSTRLPSFFGNGKANFHMMKDIHPSLHLTFATAKARDHRQKQRQPPTYTFVEESNLTKTTDLSGVHSLSHANMRKNRNTNEFFRKRQSLFPQTTFISLLTSSTVQSGLDEVNPSAGLIGSEASVVEEGEGKEAYMDVDASKNGEVPRNRINLIETETTQVETNLAGNTERGYGDNASLDLLEGNHDEGLPKIKHANQQHNTTSNWRNEGIKTVQILPSQRSPYRDRARHVAYSSMPEQADSRCEYSKNCLGVANGSPKRSYMETRDSTLHTNSRHIPEHLTGRLKFSEHGAVGHALQSNFEDRKKYTERKPQRESSDNAGEIYPLSQVRHSVTQTPLRPAIGGPIAGQPDGRKRYPSAFPPDVSQTSHNANREGLGGEDTPHEKERAKQREARLQSWAAMLRLVMLIGLASLASFGFSAWLLVKPGRPAEATSTRQYATCLMMAALSGFLYALLSLLDLKKQPPPTSYAFEPLPYAEAAPLSMAAYVFLDSATDLCTSAAREKAAKSMRAQDKTKEEKTAAEQLCRDPFLKLPTEEMSPSPVV